jgi:hypothetical protein
VGAAAERRRGLLMRELLMLAHQRVYVDRRKQLRVFIELVVLMRALQPRHGVGPEEHPQTDHRFYGYST